ncbi:alpha/beta fold hydrolase [Streptomyces sp. NPDC050560]|uniref:alpha/beta fold hydrolase n=1 Tax=Streptomyces sp. NPDC050560 TaxID=3365630 RepID=UPI0037B7DD80
MTEAGGLASMDDGARIRWRRLGRRGSGEPPVVLLHGGPGLPDYLEDVAAAVADLAPVHRYDQRGTGGSEWRGCHTLARHVRDLAGLLDLWEAPRAMLVGHSYGSDLACRFCLAHPERVAGMLLMCGPFVGDWRAGYRRERARRMSAAERDRLRALEERTHRTADEEAELLTLAWSTDHAEPVRGRSRAARAAVRRRPVNWDMNRELGAEGRTDPLAPHLDTLRVRLPERTEIIGADRAPRPLTALASLAHRLGVPLTCVEDAGHEPWLEQPETVRGHLRRFVRAGGTTWAGDEGARDGAV